LELLGSIELDIKLQEKKKELEENFFAQQKILIQQILYQRLEEIKQGMAQKVLFHFDIITLSRMNIT